MTGTRQTKHDITLQYDRGKELRWSYQKASDNTNRGYVSYEGQTSQWYREGPLHGQGTEVTHWW